MNDIAQPCTPEPCERMPLIERIELQIKDKEENLQSLRAMHELLSSGEPGSKILEIMDKSHMFYV